MNLSVQPLLALTNPSAVMLVSNALQVLVPTTKTFFFDSNALLILSADFCDTSKNSESILCLVRSSTSTGLKVPRPI